MLRSALLALLAALLPLSASAQPTPRPGGQPVPAASSETARDVLAQIRPAVIQIKGFFGTNTAQTFHGTGFAAAPGGIFLTNYHVVAELVHHPARYRLEYRTPDGRTGPVTVLDVDVRNDLAVVRADGLSPEPLAISTTPAVKGQRAYAVGFPLDVGLTITEGVSNGKVEDSFEARIHYSGAINAGMSGGPALNSAGEVIGINVSGYRFQQLVSFLVPAEHAVALLQRSAERGAAQPDLHKAVQAQLHEHSKALLGALEGRLETQTVSGYRLAAKLAPFIDCNAAGDPTPGQPVLIVRVSCSAKSGVHVSRGVQIGDLNYLHVVMSATRVGQWRFYKQLSDLTSAKGGRGSREHVGSFACKESVVGLKGFDASLLVCTRGYRKLEGLYDFVVRVSSLNGTQQGFASHLDMYGLEFEAGMSFLRRFIDAMEWTP